MSALRLDGLRVELANGDEVVDDVSFSIEPGKVLGLVGESGSGKTTVATALLGHARRGARIVSGTAVIDGTDVLSLDGDALRDARGRLVAYVPQEPASTLNPALRIGTQLTEVIEVHQPEVSTAEARERAKQALDEVRLPADDDTLARFPHQLSGGQQQRVCIAMAFLLRPRLVVLDEPTTGLDVTTQAHVLTTVRRLCDRHRVAALYVTHDLAVVATTAHRVLVMYAGRIVEEGTTRDLFSTPAHPYTDKLVEAIPDLGRRRDLQSIPGQAPRPGERGGGCAFTPRCARATAECRAAVPALTRRDRQAFRCVHPLTSARATADEAARRTPVVPRDAAVLSVAGLSARHGQQAILDEVSFDLRAEECLALVGESGSGKTTLARCLVGLHRDWDGNVRYDGQALARRARDRAREIRREIQYVFQSPYKSLNPRRSIGETLAVPARLFRGSDPRAARALVDEVLERVSLGSSTARAHPDQLSGGERQRVAIARALVCRPRILICDEVTSALDVSVQASIVRLLRTLQQEEGLALIFVTHDLSLVGALADRVLVLRWGSVAEAGVTEQVLGAPESDYTRELLADTPTLAAALADPSGPGRNEPSLGAHAGSTTTR